ncbi:MAG: c-type cytochrome [Ginsengibacter sp.]
MKRLTAILGGVAIITSLFSFKVWQDDPWKVPEKYEKMKNPVASGEASINAGKDLYVSYCVNCHGRDGKGIGTKAVNLVTPPANFTTSLFQKQTDGALLYKIYFGHKDMPGFKRRIPGNKDVIEGTFGQTRSPGDLINYLRTFGEK